MCNLSEKFEIMPLFLQRISGVGRSHKIQRFDCNFIFLPFAGRFYQLPFDSYSRPGENFIQYRKFIRLIYNSLGQLVKNLDDGIRDSGLHRLLWDGTNNEGNRVSSGIYFYQVGFDGITLTRKMLLLY